MIHGLNSSNSLFKSFASENSERWYDSNKVMTKTFDLDPTDNDFCGTDCRQFEAGIPRFQNSEGENHGRSSGKWFLYKYGGKFIIHWGQSDFFRFFRRGFRNNRRTNGAVLQTWTEVRTFYPRQDRLKSICRQKKMERKIGESFHILLNFIVYSEPIFAHSREKFPTPYRRKEISSRVESFMSIKSFAEGIFYFYFYFLHRGRRWKSAL